MRKFDEITAFLTPADEKRFEEEFFVFFAFNTPEDFKDDIDLKEREEGKLLVNRSMIFFSQDVLEYYYKELEELIDSNTHLVFRMFATSADRDSNPERYDRIMERGTEFMGKINVVNEPYSIEDVRGEYLGKLSLELLRTKSPCTDVALSVGTYLRQNPDWVAKNPETDG